MGDTRTQALCHVGCIETRAMHVYLTSKAYQLKQAKKTRKLSVWCWGQTTASSAKARCPQYERTLFWEEVTSDEANLYEAIFKEIKAYVCREFEPYCVTGSRYLKIHNGRSNWRTEEFGKEVPERFMVLLAQAIYEIVKGVRVYDAPELPEWCNPDKADFLPESNFKLGHIDTYYMAYENYLANWDPAGLLFSQVFMEYKTPAAKPLAPMW
jgi:hypothetical protein